MAVACRRCCRVQLGDQSGVAFHQLHAGGAARGGFKPQRAGAGKGVQAAPAAQVLAQPVEQGFAHAVGRGAQARALGHGQAGALPGTADDADLARAFGGCGSICLLACCLYLLGQRGAAAAWALRISALMALV